MPLPLDPPLDPPLLPPLDPPSPPANATSCAIVPLNLSTSTPPLMPETEPLSEYWKNFQFVHGAGMSGHVGPYCAIQSALEANDALPPTSSRQKYLPV